jgi:RimJ/RimL family protein N-acetyltransferase
MTASDAFRSQPTLIGEVVRLEPLTTAVLDGYLVGLADPDVSRFTGSHEQFERAPIEQWLATRADQHDRADWAVISIADGAFLGEAVINGLDTANSSANYRIWLGGPHIFGRGYGTETTRLVVDYALDVVGLHRLSLTVFTFNPRARRVYEKCGFVVEGRRREVLYWDGAWHDELIMAVLASDPRDAGCRA